MAGKRARRREARLQAAAEALTGAEAEARERIVTHATAAERDGGPRDGVTGERLTPAMLAQADVRHIAPRDERITRHPLDGHATARDAVPATIDSTEPYPEGALGGKRWTQPFTRYIARVLPLSVAAERDDWRYWWRVPYVVERLRAQMGAERWAVAMARIASGLPLERVERGGFIYDAHICGVIVAQPLRRREREWVLGCERQARRIVRNIYFPYDRRAPRDIRALAHRGATP